jgi:hypothetical protein
MAEQQTPASVVEAFGPEFYQAMLDHALAALRDRKPFEINADGAYTFIQQAAADRAALTQGESRQTGDDAFGLSQGSEGWPDRAAEPLYAAAAPAPDAWRYPVLTARGAAIERMARAMWNGKAWPSASGNAKAAEQLAEDALAALEAAAPTQGGGQLSGNTGELAGAVEIVTEWLAMAEAVPTQTHGVLRYPPISQGEINAIALLAKGGGRE